MLKNYPQKLIDELYEEGDRDYQFFYEFLGFVGNLYLEPYMKNIVDLNKNINQRLEDALSLAKFFIASNAYIGFHMEEYGKIDKIFEDPRAFEDFIKISVANDGNYLERITTKDRYTVGLKKVQSGAKAPPVTSEIERMFSARQCGEGK